MTLPETEEGSGALRMRVFGLTDRGLVRSGNEDQFLVTTLSRGDEQDQLLLVADGMGGHRGGEHASAMAVELIEQFVQNAFEHSQARGADGEVVLHKFNEALRRTDAQVCRLASLRPELWGMGTTVTLAYIIRGEAFIAHVGDSRCYLFRDSELHRLTHDHTLVQELISQGTIRPEDAAKHQWRHVITNVVGGTKAGVQPEMHKLHLEAGDLLLLCSDGLNEMLSDEEIAAVLHHDDDPRRLCETLVSQANQRGGKDNVTVVVARFE
jgi:protein phosphatase